MFYASLSRILLYNSQMDKLMRVSIIDYLNALPLNVAFKDGKFSDGLEFIYDFPSQCADNLAAGKVDAGLISSIEYQRIPGLKVAAGVCIASRDQVRSVVIVTRKDFRDIKILAVDRFSRSSSALAMILFQKRCAGMPQFVTMAPDLKKMMKVADAALLIGDAALKQEGHDLKTLDLAQLWFQETGLPFVFAFWALGKDALSRGLADIFRKAKDYGLNKLQTHWKTIGSQYGLDPEQLQFYLTRNIHYDLGEEEIASLDCFYSYCHQYGLIPEKKRLHLA